MTDLGEAGRHDPNSVEAAGEHVCGHQVRVAECRRGLHLRWPGWLLCYFFLFEQSIHFAYIGV